MEVQSTRQEWTTITWLQLPGRSVEHHHLRWKHGGRKTTTPIHLKRGKKVRIDAISTVGCKHVAYQSVG